MIIIGYFKVFRGGKLLEANAQFYSMPKSMQSSILSWRIAHKGIALVILPLVVNCAWIVMLNSCLESTEKLAEMERSQTLLLQHVNGSFLKFAEVLGMVTSYAATGQNSFRVAYLKRLNDVRDELRELRALKSYKATVEQFADAVIQDAESQTTALERARIPDDKESLEAGILAVKQFRRFTDSAQRTIVKIQRQISTQQMELDRIHADQAETRARTRLMVFLGLGANIILAGVLAFYFVSDITRRLRTLVVNAEKLPLYEPLQDVVGGHDELSEVDAALHNAAAELERSREYRSSLMQMMAHDLRSPLAALKVSLALLYKKNQEKIGDDGLRQMNGMNASIDRLINLISDLLILERLERNELVLDQGPENIREVAQVAIDSVASLAEARKITIENAVPKLYVTCDRERILQVLVNYLSNAIKHSPSSADVSVSAAEEGGAPGMLRVEVRDRGAGIDSREAAQLFEKFHQLRAGKELGGSGLGLAISRLIIEAHGGRVGVVGRKGEGAEFWFTLPYGEEAK